LAQEKPLPQVGADMDGALPLDALAKLDTRRSTFSPPHFGHFTPSLPAPIFWRRENVFWQSLHRYS
jgi:hypothetical protein